MKWWGYVSRGGEVKIKRYFSEVDIEEAKESPFVAFVFGPIKAKSKEEAVKKFKEEVAIKLQLTKS